MQKALPWGFFLHFVIVGATVLRAAEGELHVGSEHLIHTNHIGPLHALLLLELSLGIGGLCDFFTNDGLSAGLLEGKASCRTVHLGDNAFKNCHFFKSLNV